MRVSAITFNAVLADRNYMREDSGGTPRPVSVLLMVVLVAVFALQCISDVYLPAPLEPWLALTSAGLRQGYAWQLITFQFLHGGVLHLAGNLLGLWYFGRFVESVVGRGRFLFAYLACGMVGGLLQGVLMILFPGHFGLLLYGASAGISGLFAIFARIAADSEIRWNFIIPIKAINLLWIYTAIAAFFTLVPSPRDPVAHAAHLGGILAGLAFVRLGWHHDYITLPWEAWAERFKSRGSRPRREMPRPTVLAGAGRRRLEKGAAAEPASADFISKEVDPILDKISSQGIHSLTAREREILEAARKKMSRR